MTNLRSLPAPALALAAALVLAAPALSAQTVEVMPEQIDEIFEDFDSARSPGCVVGVDGNGERVGVRAYGMADLEHRVANAPNTIFEAGSVSKQFTAAAVVLLSLDGVLSLDDDVREWIPEIPDYGETITLRHMLTHTSGLRDWGSVAGISGWGRSARTHDHDHVIDILSRQSALNFMPGEAYSYSNSGYNLLAEIVTRASGTPFAEFSRERIFEPLGMHDTQWRDDYRRIVPGRSSAYSSSRDGGFRINRPIEHVHGNGGLLTTIPDMLTWNEHLRRGTLGPEFMAEMHTRGVLNDGEEIHYASGLQFGSQNGVERISHTGATSGYRAYLALFPDEALSVALLCNVSSANPGGLGGRVAALFLPDPPPEPVAEQGQASGEADPDEGEAEAPSFDPSPADLEEYEGTYHSDDAETILRLEVRDGELVAHRRPSTEATLRPDDEEDTFGGFLGTIRFIRDESGRVVELSVQQSRVWDMRFERVED